MRAHRPSRTAIPAIIPQVAGMQKIEAAKPETRMNT